VDLSRNIRGGATAKADQNHEVLAETEDEESDAVPDLDDARKTVTVVTSASLPWMTGTAVNPLLRAAHLTKDREAGAVTLLVPWVELEDQRKLFPNNITFATQADQRAYVLQWVAEAAAMPAAARKLTVSFYPGRYLSSYGSIFSIGPYLEALPATDLCILEEPEHLAWFRYPELGWADKFGWVVGVMHTNYLAYAQEERGAWAVPPVWALNQVCSRAYCHRIVKLSAALQSYAPHKECVSNVHGVRKVRQHDAPFFPYGTFALFLSLTLRRGF
jgi:digalactosyldiacylglycerol synthase